MSENTSSFVSRMNEVIDHIKAAQSLCARGPLDYYLRKLVDHSNALLTRFSPIQVGDNAVIVKSIDFKKAPGWKGAEKHLEIGTVGSVTDVDYYDGRFVFQFVPHKQYYRDLDGKWIESKTLYNYSLSESYLQKTT